MPITVNGSVGITYPDNSTQESAAPTGATTTNTSSNVTLTAASTQLQVINATASGVKVVLPDATTMPLGSNQFNIAISGTSPQNIETITTSGINTSLVTRGSSGSISLASNAANQSGYLYNGEFRAGGYTNVTSLSIPGGPSNAQIVYLTSTSFALGYKEGANNITVVIGTLSGNTVSFGTPVTVFAGAASSAYNLVALTSTLLGVAVYTASNTVRVYPVSVSGTTLTVGTASATTTSSGDIFCMCDASSTTAVLWVRTGISSRIARVVTFSGTSAPTLGATMSPSFVADPAVTKRLTTNVVFSSNRVFTVSGTTVSEGTPAIFTEGSGRQAFIVSPTQVLIVSTTDLNIPVNGSFITLSISGSTVTVLATDSSVAGSLTTQFSPSSYLTSLYSEARSDSQSLVSYNTSTGLNAAAVGSVYEFTLPGYNQSIGLDSTTAIAINTYATSIEARVIKLFA